MMVQVYCRYYVLLLNSRLNSNKLFDYYHFSEIMFKSEYECTCFSPILTKTPPYRFISNYICNSLTTYFQNKNYFTRYYANNLV